MSGGGDLWEAIRGAQRVADFDTVERLARELAERCSAEGDVAGEGDAYAYLGGALVGRNEGPGRACGFPVVSGTLRTHRGPRGYRTRNQWLGGRRNGPRVESRRGAMADRRSFVDGAADRRREAARRGSRQPLRSAALRRPLSQGDSQCPRGPRDHGSNRRCPASGVATGDHRALSVSPASAKLP